MKRNSFRTLGIWLVIILIAIFVLGSMQGSQIKNISYSELLDEVKNGKVTDVEISYDKETAQVKYKDDNVIREVNIPDVENLLDNIQKTENQNINVQINDEPFMEVFSDMLLPISSLILILMMFFMLFAGARNGWRKQRKQYYDIWKKQSKTYK